MEAQVKTAKTEIPHSIERGLDELWELEWEVIRPLRTIQHSVSCGLFGTEKDIKRLRYLASQVALECLERVCRETCEDVKERFTSMTGSTDAF
jgi:hypothetical protein